MLPATHTVLLNEIRKKQGRPFFALCRACGLAPADGANAKFYLLKHGYIMENPSTQGLYVVNKNAEAKPARKPLPPAENPYRVVRRNEPGPTYAAETTGVLTSEAKAQRKLAETLETPREEPVYQMAKPEPIVEKSLAEQIAEELRWHEQWDREQEELAAEIEAEESDDDVEGTEDEPEADADSDTPEQEEPELDEDEMANLNPIALQTLEKARATLNIETPAEETKQEEEKPATVYGKALPVPLTPGGKPLVNDAMILEYLTERGPATMAKITEYFGRKGSGLATKLSKMVRQNLISQRDRIPGQLVVYLTNGDYLREVSGSMPKQILPTHSQVNAERGSMLATREQTITVKVSESAGEIKSGQALVLTDEGVKPASTLVDVLKEQVKDLPQSTFFTGDGVSKVVEIAPVEPTRKIKTETFPTPIEIKASVTIHQYDVLTPEEQKAYLELRIMGGLADGVKSFLDLEKLIPDVPAFDLRTMLGVLNKRRRIIRAKAPAGFVAQGKVPAFWQLLDNDSRASRRDRAIGAEEILALFTDSEMVLSTSDIAEVFDRTASGLGVTLNALCKQRKIVKCGESPARYRLANATLSSILEEIEKSFTVKNSDDKPNEDWLPILNRLETLIGGNAAQVLADIQAYLERRMKDD